VSSWSVEGLASHVDGFRLGPIDLDLRPGHAVAVLGSSGAGKTTLLRTLAGFVPVDAGCVVRDGVDLTDRPPEERCLGYVPQGLGLFPHRTVERNVTYPLELRGITDALERTRPLLERFRLTSIAKRYPSRLSGGEAERTAIARALAAEPELLLWDEPWQALDVEARFELGRVFEELRETAEVPVVVVTHDPSLAFSVADSFLVLRAGRVGLRADATTLLANPSDAFIARFVGFENVFDLAALEPGPEGSFTTWLRERAGPEGIAFGRPVLSPPGAPGGRWDGVVRSARPTPEGLAVTVQVDALSVALRMVPPFSAPFPSVRARVRFDVEEMNLHPLGRVAAPWGKVP
jgi:putative spermidine/putrescine transport system ATP-binding protein